MRQTKIVLAIVAVAAMLTACGKNQNLSNVTSTPVAGVYGGNQVEAADPINKSIVALYSSDEGFLCTGSILTNDLILTAGHCIAKDSTKMVVIFGPKMIENNKLAPGAVVRKAINGLHHPDFVPGVMKATMMSDVGLVRFEGGLPTGYQPATVLVNYKAHIQKGTPVVMAGYGISNVLFKSGAGTLRKVTLAVDDPNYSAAETSIDQGMRKGICEGDSGGPSYLQADGKYLLWGVTSRGAGLFTLAPCIFSSIYTRVDYYWSWLQKAAAQMGSSLPAMPQN
jgi:secreted trypsin-like serine protease